VTDIADYRAVNRARAVKTEFYQLLVKKKDHTETMMTNEYRKSDPNKDKILGYVAEISCIRSQMDELVRNINNLESDLERL
jgi:hypothetical protein